MQKNPSFAVPFPGIYQFLDGDRRLVQKGGAFQDGLLSAAGSIAGDWKEKGPLEQLGPTAKWRYDLWQK